MASAATRMRLHRRREAAGRVVLRIEVDVTAVADLLVSAGMLDPLKADMRHEIELAVEKFLAALAKIEETNQH